MWYNIIVLKQRTKTEGGENMPYRYDKLRGKIVEKYRTYTAFAKAMNVTIRTISDKLNCKKVWRQDEIEKACSLLDIPINKIHQYFFNL